MNHPFATVARALAGRSVRYVLIGVSGANLYAPAGQAVFVTDDFDLFLPLDPDNLVEAWAACRDAGLDLWLADEPLQEPQGRWLAERVIERRVAVRAASAESADIDLSLVMEGFDFGTVWAARRVFEIEGAEVPVARLLHIVMSKQATGRDKDKLFLAAHRDALEQLLRSTEEE